MAFSLNSKVAIDKDRRAYLGSCFPIGSNPLDGLEGNIYRFVYIDWDQPWLNTLTGNKADPDEVENNVAIPEHLKPNFSAIRYNFFPRTHRLVFEITRLDPTTHKPTSFPPVMAEKFFRKLFSDNSIQLAYPDIEITIEQSNETLDEIFSISTLRTLEIFIKRPNPNDGDLEQEIERQLAKERADSLLRIIKAKEDKNGLNPSQRTKVQAKIALANGYVQGSGYDAEGNRREYKTEDKPTIKEGEYNPDGGQGYSRAFTELAEAAAASPEKN